MKKIPLRNRKHEIVNYALIDDKDYKKVSKYLWFLNSGYVKKGRNETHALLHRFILNLPKSSLGGNNRKVVDHINRNTLDNRRKNLRVVTHSENLLNGKIGSRNTSGVMGVYIFKGKIEKYTRWGSYLFLNKKRIFLGTFKTKEDAISARKLAEKKYAKIIKPPTKIRK